MTATVVLHDAASRMWLRFQNPLEVVTADCLDAVGPALQRVETKVNRDRCWAAGFVSYEAAPAFDLALRAQPPGSFPLLWFGLYQAPEEISLPAASTTDLVVTDWVPDLAQNEYNQAFEQLKHHLSKGEIYQANYTFRLRSAFEGDAWSLFLKVAAAQQADFAAFVDTGRFAVCSASPELFFELKEGTLTSRPMKGTAARAWTQADDLRRAEWLHQSEKNRAENIMIVDMIRNDMGRIARIGSVTVPRLFDLERYPTVWQMTSTVTAETTASLADIFKALFPCASITGAPKARAMQVIQSLEPEPRHIYTGSIGFLAPGRRAQFNVAIRTVLVDRENRQAEYGVGGGIVWDSRLGDEYEECLTKAQVLTRPRLEFQLFETLLWTPAEGYFLLPYHLERLRASVAYFGFSLDESAVLERLNRLAQSFPDEPCRVKLILARNGTLTGAFVPLIAGHNQEPVRLGLARQPVDSTNLLLYHKTTSRKLYEDALASRPDCEDVALWNERGEITEATIANLVVRLHGELVTPPVASGLLAGTYRAFLLDQKKIRERVIPVADFLKCEEIFVVNSVRKWRKAVLSVAG
ncbi:MAG: aminodeoxychorismate synthase component I [Blastocatellia bacterium]|nr:aminodeoxychorismate synthase component I [Blastocatellia bacterium]